jgi:cytidine deaminase
MKKTAVTDQRLIAEARRAREQAYAPYSRFRVGAALLAESGRIFTGCNLENASYGAGLCAERAALAAAVGAGERNFVSIAVVSDSLEATAPCGICRQALNEFAPDLKVIMAGRKAVRKSSLRKLLPHSFGPGSLKRK